MMRLPGLCLAVATGDSAEVQQAAVAFTRARARSQQLPADEGESDGELPVGS